MSNLISALDHLLMLPGWTSDGLIMVTLPPATWLAAKHDVMKRQYELLESRGRSFSWEYPPPKGESWKTGFWLLGCWVRRG